MFRTFFSRYEILIFGKGVLMVIKNSYQLSRGCLLTLGLGGIVLLAIGACLFWTFQMPNELRSGLGRGNRIANVMVVTTEHRVRLVFLKDGSVGLEFIDKPGIFNLAREITLTDEERQSFEHIYQEWCAKPPQRSNEQGEHHYEMGFSCDATLGRYIVVAESQIPPVLLNLFKRAAALQPKD